jgi:phosphoribosylpyrophosphate synthetase
MASALGNILAKMENRLSSSSAVSVTESELREEHTWLSSDRSDTAGCNRQRACSDHTHCVTYHVIYHKSMQGFAKKLRSQGTSEKKFVLYDTEWAKFDDETDKITIQGAVNDKGELKPIDSPTYFKEKNILFVASFHNNDVTMSQFHVLAHLCESFAKTVTVLLPYYSTATMERVDIVKDGIQGAVPSANTLARLFNGLPSVGFPIRLMTYDLHTLQNRFYVTGHACASLHTAVPMMLEEIQRQDQSTRIDAIAFPDAGAHKRFSDLFSPVIKSYPVICGKVRTGARRVVTVIDGKGTLETAKHILIVDDQTKTGGTIVECAKQLRLLAEEYRNTNIKISAFVTHVVFDKKFTSTNGSGLFETLDNFYTTDSIPNKITTHKGTIQVIVPRNDQLYSFLRRANVKVLDLAPLVIKDL